MVNLRRPMMAALMLAGALGCRAPQPRPPASLAANMAAMEQHMNVLFRHLGQGDQLPQLRAAAAGLLRLQTASADLAPDPDRAALFRRRSEQAAALMRQLLLDLDGGRHEAARQCLLELDRHRRECHSLFG